MDALHDSILQFYERLGVDDPTSEDAGRDTILSDLQVERHVKNLLMSYDMGIAHPEDLGLADDATFEDMAVKWLAWVNEHMSAYAIATLVTRGEVLVLTDRDSGEFTFVHKIDALKASEEAYDADR